MHRRKTQLARRLNRVLPSRVDPYAKALENRGIRATYELHDRVLSNRRSRDRFRHEGVVLDEVQRRIVSDIEREGYSLVTFSDLFPDPERWSEIEEMRDAFVSETEADLAKGGRARARTRRARSSWCAFTATASVSASTTLVPLPARRGGCSTSLTRTWRMWSKLEYVDVWYSVPQAEGASRASSQRWHRDYNDKHLLKAFLYLVDVDEEMGPFQYMPGSHPGGQYADAWPWKPAREELPVGGRARGNGSPRLRSTVRRPEGTLVFCNTAGFHRGGFSTTSAARAGDCDVLVTGVARVADRAKLRVRGCARRARRRHAVRAQLTGRQAMMRIGRRHANHRHSYVLTTIPRRARAGPQSPRLDRPLEQRADDARH